MLEKMIHNMSRLAAYELSGEHVRTGVQNNFLVAVVVGQVSDLKCFYIDQVEDRIIVSIDS